VRDTLPASRAMKEAAANVIQLRQPGIHTNEDVHETLKAATDAAREAARTHYLSQWNAKYLAVFRSYVDELDAAHDNLLAQCLQLLPSVPQMKETQGLKKKLWGNISLCVIPELPAAWSLDITGGFLKNVVTGGQRMAESIGKTVNQATEYMEKKSLGFRNVKAKFTELLQQSGIAEKVESLELPQMEVSEGSLINRNLQAEILPKISEGTTHLMLSWNQLPERLEILLQAVYLDAEGLQTDTSLQLALTKRKGELDSSLMQTVQNREEQFKHARTCIEKAANTLNV